MGVVLAFLEPQLKRTAARAKAANVLWIGPQSSGIDLQPFAKDLQHPSLSMTSKPSITIRELAIEEAAQLLHLFRRTVRTVNCKDYNPEQIEAWASEQIDVVAWSERFRGRFAYVAVINEVLAGFVDMDSEGYLDRLFVAVDFQRCGVASKLLQRLLKDAKEYQISHIRTQSSITAKSFFERLGFVVEKQQEVECRGQRLKNFRMVLDLTELQNPQSAAVHINRAGKPV